jgi:hypothetical protein
VILLCVVIESLTCSCNHIRFLTLGCMSYCYFISTKPVNVVKTDYYCVWPKQQVLWTIFYFFINSSIHRIRPGPPVARVPTLARNLSRLINVNTALKRTQSHTQVVKGPLRSGRELDHSPSCNAELSTIGAISTSCQLGEELRCSPIYAVRT